jgi:hypothetical protein
VSLRTVYWSRNPLHLDSDGRTWFSQIEMKDIPARFMGLVLSSRLRTRSDDASSPLQQRTKA